MIILNGLEPAHWDLNNALIGISLKLVIMSHILSGNGHILLSVEKIDVITYLLV